MQSLVRYHTGIQILHQLRMKLYRNGDGYFNCLYPNGKKISAANLYDLGLVLTGADESLSSDQIKVIVSFVRNELITPIWARSLASTDLDVTCKHRMNVQ